MVSQEDKVTVIPEQLTKARGALGLEPSEVADALGMDVEGLNRWERGASEPSLEDLWNLAELYKRSTDYFLRLLPALPEHLSFRLKHLDRIQDLPPKAREVIVRFEELCRAEAELEEALQKPHPISVEKAEHSHNAEELANAERIRLDLGERPIRDLRKLLASQGIRIFILPIPDIPSIELSGMSWWHDDYGPCILVNGRNNSGRRSFTLAHEYAHLLHADPATICAFMLDVPEERFANRFAANFLMPGPTLRIYFTELVGPPGTLPLDQDLGRLSSHFAVSLEAMGRRLEQLELIPLGTTDSRIAQWEKRPVYYRGRKGPMWRKQLGNEFVSLALEAHSSGHMSVTKLAKYFGLDVRETLQVVRESSTPP
jgi:Zn-dependent peptidase ImmA (M78 family)/DNA-binding XRE family transcriptional regulator